MCKSQEITYAHIKERRLADMCVNLNILSNICGICPFGTGLFKGKKYFIRHMEIQFKLDRYWDAQLNLSSGGNN